MPNKNKKAYFVDKRVLPTFFQEKKYPESSGSPAKGGPDMKFCRQRALNSAIE